MRFIFIPLRVLRVLDFVSLVVKPFCSRLMIVQMTAHEYER